MAKKAKQRRRHQPTEAASAAAGTPSDRFSLGLVAVFAAAVAVYANALGNGFVWDDPIILERQLVVFDSVADVLVTPRGIPHYSPDYYRPTTTTSYLLDWWLGGDDPWVFHLSVILAHAFVAVLVSLLSRQMLGTSVESTWAAVAAGLLFAVHPVHTESVAWAAGRSDVLAALFSLAVLVVTGRRQLGIGAVVLAGALAFLALGAKEVALTLYALLVVRHFLDPEASFDGAALRRYAGVGIALLVYLVLRRMTIGDVVGEQPGEVSMFSVLPQMVWALGGYVGELLWPFPLNAYIDRVAVGPLTLLGLGLLLAGVVWGVGRWRSDQPEWLFAILWFPITIAPSLAILWKIPEVPMAERYAYLPSVSLSLLLALAVKRYGPTRKELVAGLTAVLVVLCSIAVWQRNPVWRDDVSLWEDTRHKTTQSGMAWRSLGSAYLKLGRFDEAEVALRKALTLLNPRLGLQGIYSNLGTLAMHRQHYAGARESYQQALELTPDAPDILFNLALSIYHQGNQSDAAGREALPHFLRASQLSPHDSDIDVILGQVYLALGDGEQGRAYLEEALRKGVRPETRQGIEALLGQPAS